MIAPSDEAMSWNSTNTSSKLIKTTEENLWKAIFKDGYGTPIRFHNIEDDTSKVSFNIRNYDLIITGSESKLTSDSKTSKA